MFIHSPVAGRGTWRKVADLCNGEVPDLTAFVGADPPIWKAFVELATGEETVSEVVVVGHSGAGPLLPAIGANLPSPPRALIFVDAGVPPARGHFTISPEQRRFYEDHAVDGTLPRFSALFGDDVMAEMIPDPVERAALASEEPEIPLTYFHEPIPVPSGWSRRRCGYVRLSAAYDDALDEANARGWPTASLDLSHVAAVTHPDDVWDAIVNVLDRL